MKSNLYKKTQSVFSKGFSLIELIVAVSIITIITSVALFHQAKFSSDILITNMAYEVALTIRQAEVFGISSKGDGSLPSGLSNEKYRVGYGVHFFGDNTGNKPDSFQTFIDVPDQSGAPAPGHDTHFNYEYDAAGGGNTYTDTITSDIAMTQGEKIHRFCAHPTGTGTTWDCWDSTVNKSNKSLDIVFVKPNPDAHITIGENGAFSSNYDEAKIVIESGLGDKCRTVTTWISGQVSVDPIVPSDTSVGCEQTYN
jgi:prepilin-type N-terminal cleavage/methylation domain-containing protein